MAYDFVSLWLVEMEAGKRRAVGINVYRGLGNEKNLYRYFQK